MEVYDGILRILSLVVVWVIPATLIVAVVAFVVGAPALTLGGLVLRLYGTMSVRLRRKTRTETRGFNLGCSIDADCPPGYICVDGVCEPNQG